MNPKAHTIRRVEFGPGVVPAREDVQADIKDRVEALTESHMARGMNQRFAASCAEQEIKAGLAQ